MSIVVGIDPSLSHTAGHIIVFGPVCPEMRSFAIKSEPKKFAHPIARLDYLTQRLCAELPKPIIGQSLLVVEGYAMGARNGREALGEWGGQIRLTAHRLGYDVLVVPPTTLKKYVTGKGNGEKDLVMLEVFKRWAYSPTDNNDADAYALMQFGVDWLHRDALPKPPKRVLECFRKIELWKGSAAA